MLSEAAVAAVSEEGGAALGKDWIHLMGKFS
jgi:hypothetical protein